MHLQWRTTGDNSPRRIMRLVTVFILETHKKTNYKCLPKLLHWDGQCVWFSRESFMRVWEQACYGKHSGSTIPRYKHRQEHFSWEFVIRERPEERANQPVSDSISWSVKKSLSFVLQKPQDYRMETRRSRREFRQFFLLYSAKKWTMK